MNLSYPVWNEKDLVLSLCLQTDHDGEPTEIWDSLISNENEENSVLVNCVTPEVELPKTSQVTADDTEEEKEKAGFTDDDFTTDPLLSTSPSVITPTETAEPAKVCW